MFAVDRDVMESYIDNRNMIDSFPRYWHIVIDQLSAVFYYGSSLG